MDYIELSKFLLVADTFIREFSLEACVPGDPMVAAAIESRRHVAEYLVLNAGKVAAAAMNQQSASKDLLAVIEAVSDWGHIESFHQAMLAVNQLNVSMSDLRAQAAELKAQLEEKPYF